MQLLDDTSRMLTSDVLSLTTSGNEVQEKWPSGAIQAEKEVTLQSHLGRESKGREHPQTCKRRGGGWSLTYPVAAELLVQDF